MLKEAYVFDESSGPIASVARVAKLGELPGDMPPGCLPVH